ncbi:MAG TPA: GNAT family N-acetyltransferase [Roseiarcus sp.]
MSARTRALRDFVEGDLPALIDLWVAAWSETLLDIDFDGRRTWLMTHLRALRASGVEIIVGLDEDQRPTGFAAIDAKSGYLDQLCVAPAESGSGLASALIDEAKRRSPIAVELDVNEVNLRALRFYEREGFSLVGRGLNPQSGLPTLKMRWRPME